MTQNLRLMLTDRHWARLADRADARGIKVHQLIGDALAKLAVAKPTGRTPRINAEGDQQVIDLRELGYSITEIATRMQVSENVIDGSIARSLRGANHTIAVLTGEHPDGRTAR